MEFLKVSGWDKWQTYRSDRGKPPWIKVHRELQQNWEWVDLPDHQRGQLVSMWLLASSRDGVIPASPDKVKKLCNMSETPDLQAFVNLGFLEGDVCVTSERRQDVVPDKRKLSTEEVKVSTDTEEENPLSGKPDDNPHQVINYLNNQTASKFQLVDSNLKLIRARIKEGRTVSELCAVIDQQIREWADKPKMQKYLRPATLFNAEKFNQYYGQLGTSATMTGPELWLAQSQTIEGELEDA